MNYRLKHKDRPAENPGTWDDSSLSFKAKGSKKDIDRIKEAILCAMSECQSQMNPKTISFIGKFFSRKQGRFIKIEDERRTDNG